ncbi:MAG: hypothetical protein OXI24_07490 [Candidatus Poribacteria bacterium]|nr:hypothetical protein [Candidatus Poribacteria bacterium]
MRFFSTHTNTRDYIGVTVNTIARVIQQETTDTNTYQLIVVVDGMNEKEAQQAARLLKRQGVGAKKVRGAKDESSAWIRLADAIAGFSWDAYKNKPYTQNLYFHMQQQGFLIQL